MNIFDMFKELERDDTKVFINGYNRVQAGFDSYELLFTDAEGNEMTVLMSNWKEAKEDWTINKT